MSKKKKKNKNKRLKEIQLDWCDTVYGDKHPKKKKKLAKKIAKVYSTKLANGISLDTTLNIDITDDALVKGIDSMSKIISSVKAITAAKKLKDAIK